VGIVVIGHDILNYVLSSPSILYMTSSVTDVSLFKPQDDRANNGRRMNMGSIKTIGKGAEHPGISSNHTPIICSLHNPIENNNPNQSG
jgi:hypothetical protein